jgi:ribosomal-protein-alanine N-acetyltransferase
MADQACSIRRPKPPEWGRILEILEASNFHHIGGPEMPSFPLSDCFVAAADDRVIGVAGYRILSETEAKTTLLAVHPDHRGLGIGVRLHRARQDFLKRQGIKTLITNTDDERVVRWYQAHFGYVDTGERIPKLATFGRLDRNEWISLKVEL